MEDQYVVGLGNNIHGSASAQGLIAVEIVGQTRSPSSRELRLASQPLWMIRIEEAAPVSWMPDLSSLMPLERRG